MIDQKPHNIIAIDPFAGLPLIGIGHLIELIKLCLREIKRSLVKLGCNCATVRRFHGFTGTR